MLGKGCLLELMDAAGMDGTYLCNGHVGDCVRR